MLIYIFNSPEVMIPLRLVQRRSQIYNKLGYQLYKLSFHHTYISWINWLWNITKNRVAYAVHINILLTTTVWLGYCAPYMLRSSQVEISLFCLNYYYYYYYAKLIKASNLSRKNNALHWLYIGVSLNVTGK
jgi:hypothetical protein